jgi:hypothetical protein
LSYPTVSIKYMFDTDRVSSSSVFAAASPPADLAASRAGASGVPLERLEAQICELAGHLAAATCRFLVLLADFDARRGWASWEMTSCAAWLSWKCQMSSGTAREHVRVARALRDLPVIRGEFWMTHGRRGILALGRRRRKPNAAIRRAARERDHCRCRFPGCESRCVDLHHIQHWIRGRVTVYEPEDCDRLVRQYLEHAPRRTGPTLIPIQV